VFDIFGAKDPQKALQRAQEYIREGKTQSAIKVLEENLTESDESFELHLNLARLYFEIEERERAVELLRSIHSIVPSRTAEVIVVLSELFYGHPSIDSGDFLMELCVAQQQYDEVSKVLRALSEREVSLLITRFEKLKQAIVAKNVISKKDFEHLIIFASLKFFVNASEAAMEAVETVIDVETFAPKFLGWARVISRERYSDPLALLMLLKSQLANKDFEGALSQARRMFEKFPDFVDSLITVIASARPPKSVESTYTTFLTELYIKKGDLDESINRLLRTLKKDPNRSDDVIKGLRELERIDPKNLKLLYALGDTYVDANRVSLAINVFDKILEVDAEQYKEIIKKYKKAFEKEPNNPEVIQALVNAYLRQKNIDAAVNIIENAYNSDPGLLDEYVQNLNTILEQDLNNPKALYLLGLCYAQKGDKEAAVVILEDLMDKKKFGYINSATAEICEVKPDDLEYLNLRARSLIAVDDTQQAFSLITSYLERNPEATGRLIPTLDVILSKKPGTFSEIAPLYEQYKKDDPFIGELVMARAYAYVGKYNKAVDIFEKLLQVEGQKDTTKRALIEVIRERPDAVPLLLAAARIFMKEGEVEIATQFFKTAQMVDPKAFFEIIDEFYDAIKTFPKDLEVRTLLVETFFNRKLWDRVIEESKRAIEVFGRDAQYFQLKLGQALVESGNLSDAVRPLMLSLEGPDDYSADVIQYLDKILNIDKSNVPAHFARGRALSKARRVNEAVEEYLLTVRILPARAEYVYDELKLLSSKAMANPRIIFALGSVEVVLKKYDDAIKHLLQSCELDASLVKRVMPIYERLAKMMASPLLDFSMAKVSHLANLKSSAIKYFMRAQAQEKKYREPAISEMKKICVEYPKDIESRKGLAEIYFNYNNFEDSLDLVGEVFKLNNKESNWAKNFVSNILKKDTKHTPSYYSLSHIFLTERDYKKAIEVYKKLLEMAPAEITKVMDILEKHEEKNSDIIFYLGILYGDTGDVKKALKLFNKLFSLNTAYGEAITLQIKEILKKNADVAEAYILASKIFAFLKEYDRAIEAIKHAEELIPQKEEIVLKKGQLYYEKGEAEEAIRIYSELLNRSKDRKAIYRLIRRTRNQYFKEKTDEIKGGADEDRLKRANIYLLMDKIKEAEKELRFAPKNNYSKKCHTLLKAKVYLKRNRPLDALEMMKGLPVDRETALVYADIYEQMASYEAAAQVLRKAAIEGMEERINGYEKLAQIRRLAKGIYFIEGRS
jgi:tetratricopeptide (TPR) repeat protein